MFINRGIAPMKGCSFMFSTKGLTTLAAGAAMFLGLAMTSTSVEAAGVDCPNGVTLDRNFNLDPALECVDYGTGNINGSATDPFLSTLTDGVLIDKSDAGGVESGVLSGDVASSTVTEIGGVTGTTGTITIANLTGTYLELFLGLKVGNSGNPTWAIFKIAADDVPGDFTYFIDPQNGAGMSHVNLYGVTGTPGDCVPGSFDPECDEPGTPEVPVPAGLPLMLTAIGIGAYMRKRARKSA